MQNKHRKIVRLYSYKSLIEKWNDSNFQLSVYSQLNINAYMILSVQNYYQEDILASVNCKQNSKNNKQ